MVRINTTAYRILHLLRWLSTNALDQNQIIQKLTELKNETPVSTDTVGLYIKTLKQIGCDIQRPSRKNQFTYSLRAHPFTYHIREEDIQLLKFILLQVADSLDYFTFLDACQWISDFFSVASNPDKHALKDKLFSELRLPNIEDIAKKSHLLQQYCEEKTLIQVKYHSAVSGPRKLVALPNQLFHTQSNFYLLSYLSDQPQAAMLRLDRMVEIKSYDDPTCLARLNDKAEQKHYTMLRVLHYNHADFDLFEADDIAFPDPVCPEHWIVITACENTFLMEQKILSSVQAIQVLYPPSLRNKLLFKLNVLQGKYTAALPC